MTDRTPQQPQQPQQSNAPQNSPAPSAPADTLRDGRVKATMWERSGESGPPYATKITRTYTDKDGQPRDTAFLSGADLLRASRVAEKAYEREQSLVRERKEREAQDGPERENRKAAHRSSRKRGTRRPRDRNRDRG